MTDHLLVKHWRKLTGKTRMNGRDVYVHPDDMKVFRNCKLGDYFNLDYPPPAYVGDVVRAPVIMLLTNGGYSDGTKNEFANQGDAERYLECLRDPSLMNPKVYSDYYLNLNYGDFLRGGYLAIVNVAAYRSQDFSSPRPRIADKLPSVQLHRRWLREMLLPEAAAGERLVIAHRRTHWKLDPEKDRQHNLVFANGRRSAKMEQASKDRVEEFLASR